MTETQLEKGDQEVTATFGKWVVLACCILTFGLSVGLPASLSAMFLDWQEMFQVDRAHTAAIHSTCIGLLFGGAIIPGYIMSRLGARITMLIGTALASTGLLLSMFATSINFLILTTGVFGGLGFCFIQIPIIPCLTVLFIKYRIVVISACTIASALMITASPILYQYYIEYNSWREVYGILACIILNTAVSALIITSVKTVKRKPTIDCDVDESAYALTEDSEIKIAEQPEEHRLILETKETQAMELETIASSQSGGDAKSKLSEQSNALLKTSKKKSCSFKNMLSKMRMSKWKFLLDPLYLLFINQNSFCLSSLFVFPFLLMDFSKTRGFDNSTGALLFGVIFFSSLFGRVLVSILNLHPWFHSITLYTLFSILTVCAMFLLIFITSYTFTVICLSVFGVGLGSVIALQMKCIVDIKAVDLKSYSIALGLCCTVEGVLDLLLPILMGYSVDVTGSYTFIIALLSSVGLVTTIMLGVGFWHFNKKESQLESPSESKTNHDSKISESVA